MTSKIILRVSILILFGLIGYSIGMFGFHTSKATVFGAIWGLTIGMLTVLSELILLRLPSLAILGGLIGGMLGLILANLLTGSSLFLHLPIAPFTSYIRTSLTILFFLVGLMVGVQRIQSLTLQSLRRLFTEQTSDKDYKILDTSVIIDGRIADISETGFLQGVLVIPQFILQELQHIADSPDPIKRNRGRRGLEILHKIQKRVDIQVEIHERDFPKIKEIDAKLVELGKYLQAKLITNDFNLNKVAELQGVPVLNVNQLANALKPVVLPGEVMEVLVLKEGKEYGQGIAYLDDGTMIVIDNAKKLIGKTVGVAVTSVLQTTAGRMIFGQLAAKDAMR